MSRWWAAGRWTSRTASIGVLLVVGALVLIGLAILAAGRPSLPLPAVVSTAAPSATAVANAASPATSPFPVRAGEPWIAYMAAIGGADTDRVWLVRPDGSDRHQLVTGLTGQQEHPDWSPDGSRIAFDHWSEDGSSPSTRIDLWVMDADGSNPTRLASCEAPCQQLSYPSWSPDGTKLVLIRFEDTAGPSAVEVLDLVTGARRVVLESTDGKVAYHNPRWSPDGRSIAFTLETYADAAEATFVSSQIAIVQADGSDGDQPRIITPPELGAAGPDWHPSGDRLIFGSSFDPGAPESRTTPSDLYTIRPDGSGLTNVTNLGLGNLRAIQPTWTPDGSQVVFTQIDGFEGGQIPAIAVMNANGTDVQRLGFGSGTAGRMRPTPP